MKLTAEELSNVPGQTRLEDEDLEGLIPQHITTREQLNEWEAENIKAARRRVETMKGGFDVLSVDALIELHKMMFGLTWKWAGTYAKRLSRFTDVRTLRSIQLRELVENTREMLNRSDGSEAAIDEIAARFHHQLTQIHPWPNGNGRHAREAANELLRRHGRPPFTWGSGDNLQALGTARERYIAALRAADKGDFSALLAFVRS